MVITFEVSSSLDELPFQSVPSFHLSILGCGIVLFGATLFLRGPAGASCLDLSSALATAAPWRSLILAL